MKTKRAIALILLSVFLLSACNGGGNEPDVPDIADDSGDVITQTEDTQGASTPGTDGDTPFARYGVLQIKDGQLSDQNGNPVQLKGMSSFGLQWGDGYWVLTDEAFDVLADDWECDIIRLAMYVTEGGYSNNPDTVLQRLERGIELATQRGMYVMIDWHVLTPGDPADGRYLSAGLDNDNMPAEFLTIKDQNPEWTGPQVFFAYIAQKYGAQGNVLYEPANEPNGNGSHGNRFDVWDSKLKPYFDSIVEVIRDYDDKGIIICGTDNWSQFIDAPINNPIDDPNIMYAMHFYSGTHDTDGNWLRDMTDNAINNGLAVFCTEWGSSTASGDGGPYIDYALRWVEFMEDRGISWCAWSMAQKNETSAAFNNTTSPTPSGAWTDSEVSIAGRFYRAMIKGDPVPMYTADMQVATDPGEAVHNGDISKIPVDAMLGDFVAIPFEFESGTREGWGIDGGGGIIQDSDITLGPAESTALMFPFTATPGKFEWEEGVRIGSPQWPASALTLSDCYTISDFKMDLYLEHSSEASGRLRLHIVLVPDGSPYWHQLDPIPIWVNNRADIVTNADGVQLEKNTVIVPFGIADYPSEMRVRNIILVITNDEDEGSDYSGNIYIDNIGFVMY